MRSKYTDPSFKNTGVDQPTMQYKVVEGTLFMRDGSQPVSPKVQGGS